MRQRAALSFLFTAIALVSRADVAGRATATNGMPTLVLWAWERPEDLRQLDPGIGVAFLAQTVVLDGSRLDVERRRQPLRVTPTTPLIAVTRIEHRPGAERAGTPDTGTIATLIAETLQLPRVRHLQVDFDATLSERPLYRAVLVAIRERVGDAVPLSITALASWCVGDPWIEGLPVNEAIPMLFRMGTADAPFLQLAEDASAGAPICRGSVGISMDEPLDLPADGRRRYVFTPRPWTMDAIAGARRWTHR